MGNGRIANRAILSRLVLLCLQLGSIPNHFFNTPYLYIIGISRNLWVISFTILPTSDIAEVATIRAITYYYAMVYSTTEDEEPHLVH